MPSPSLWAAWNSTWFGKPRVWQRLFLFPWPAHIHPSPLPGSKVFSGSLVHGTNRGGEDDPDDMWNSLRVGIIAPVCWCAIWTLIRPLPWSHTKPVYRSWQMVCWVRAPWLSSKHDSLHVAGMPFRTIQGTTTSGGDFQLLSGEGPPLFSLPCVRHSKWSWLVRVTEEGSCTCWTSSVHSVKTLTGRETVRLLRRLTHLLLQKIPINE